MNLYIHRQIQRERESLPEVNGKAKDLSLEFVQKREPKKKLSSLSVSTVRESSFFSFFFNS